MSEIIYLKTLCTVGLNSRHNYIYITGIYNNIISRALVILCGSYVATGLCVCLDTYA